MPDADKIHQLREALADIQELVEDEVDIDRNGQPNLAMRVLAIVTVALVHTK